MKRKGIARLIPWLIGLDVLLLGHIQHLTFSERFFLGQLAKALTK